jgi:hypothetical protein
MERNPNALEMDRRSGVDRRQFYSVVYFAKGGLERRSEIPRRKIKFERRQNIRRKLKDRRIVTNIIKQE